MDTMTTKIPVPPPSPLEIQRKLSVHAKPKAKLSVSPNAMSGTESDSDSQVLMDVGSAHVHLSSSLASSSQHPLQSIKEREREVVSGEETDEDDDDEEEWTTTETKGLEEQDTVLKSGYLWKKGTRRKTWKKRWFVLRRPHLAYYKTDAEYQLLRLLDLNDVHSVTPVTLKKHANTFGLVSPTRTLYLQAESEVEVKSWVKALCDARERLQATASVTPVPTPPVPIPAERAALQGASGISVSPSSNNQPVTSSDEEGPGHSSPGLVAAFSPAKGAGAPVANDPTKAILSGYLMKCGKRKTWRKRWFVLTGEKLTYCGNHMDNKHQRQIPLAQILDAMESELRSNSHNHRYHHGPIPQSPGIISPPIDELADPHGSQHTFKIITTKRTLLLCAPSEEEEIRWLSAVRALIARRSGAKTEATSPPSTTHSRGVSISGARRRSITGDAGHA